MRARFNKNAKDELVKCDKYIESKEKLQEILKSNLKNNKKLYVEIGMGKGEFISNMAFDDKDNIYLGIEICIPVLALAIKKINRFEEEHNTKLDNLYLMSFDALNIKEMLGRYKVDKIFLNFSDPWPKKRHEKRRLTSKNFLEQYRKILKKDATIEFKTDNRGLFEYSLVSMQNNGFYFHEVYLDLHKSNVFNIMTEYEQKFSKLGPIYKLVVSDKRL